jgi:iron complex transport system substrate-binding protein
MKKNPITTPRTIAQHCAPTRGAFLAGVGGLLLLGGGGGAGSGGEGSGETRTLKHEYGRTEVSGTPERVVTVGFTDQDYVLALGVTPVAVRERFGEKPYATRSRAQDELGDAEPEVLSPTELNFERIAGLGPDLIVGVSSGMTGQEYDTFSEISPTLPQSGEFVDFGVPWREQTRAIGQALGRQDRAKKLLVSGLESRLAAAREEHPEFEGAGGVVVGLTIEGDSRTPSPYGAQDIRGRFMSSLGFRIPEEISDLTGDAFFADLKPRAPRADRRRRAGLGPCGRRELRGRPHRSSVPTARRRQAGPRPLSGRDPLGRALVRQRPQPTLRARRAGATPRGGRRRRPGEGICVRPRCEEGRA